MARTSHLTRQGTTYYWRRCVPNHLAARFTCRELYRTLKTGDTTLASVRARRLSTVADRVFAVAERSPDLTRDQLTALAREWLRRELQEFEAELSSTDTSYEDPALAKSQGVEFQEALQRHAQDALDRNDWEIMSVPARALLAQRQIELPETDPLFRHLCWLLQRAYIELTRLRSARERGEYQSSPGDPLFKGIDGWSEPAPVSLPATIAAIPAGSPMSELTEKFLVERIRNKDWTPQVIKQARATFKLFTDIVGDKPIGRVDKLVMGAFLETLGKLPRLYGKGKQKRTPAEWVAEAARTGAATLSPKTIKRHVAAVSQFFEWCMGRGHYAGEKNPARNLKLSRGKRLGKQRSAWTPEQLTILFSSPLYVGCHSLQRCSEPGDLVPRDSVRFWLALIGAYSGMRLDEIAGLRPSDIREEKGLWYFNIEPYAERGVKTDAGIRRVPIHRSLIACGLLKHVENMRKAGEKQLWPEARRKVDGKFSDDLTKWFSYFRRKLKGCANVDFHSLRHTFRTKIEEAGASENVSRQVTGHKSEGMDAVYVKAFALSALSEAVNRIEYPGVTLPLPAP